VVLSKVIWQIDCQVNERGGTLFCIKISQPCVGDERVKSLTKHTLTINIEELIAWVASITLNNTCENLILVSKICW
jgi:hypothetical protein